MARNPNLYSHKRLVEVGKSRGHNMRIIDVNKCYMNIAHNNSRVYYRGGEEIIDVDAIIPRIGPSNTFYGTAVLRHFEAKGIYSLNSSIAISRSRDKLRSLQLLSQKGLPMPTTGFANSPEDTENVIKLVNGTPLIVKLLEGTQGKGIVIAETKSAATSVINAFKHLEQNILVQEFIKEAQGRDIRCFVIGDKCVAAYMRVAKEDEFRANIHQGGMGIPVVTTRKENALAIQAAKAMGLRVAGVDIIRSKEGPLVLEVNSSPGLEGIEKVSGVDIATSIFEYIEKNAKSIKRAAL